MKKTYRYPTIMILTSLQYANHLREYFVENAEKTIAFYVLPRRGTIKNFVEVYEKGIKKETKKLYSPKNLFLWHIMLYVHYITILFRYTKKKEKVYFINYLFTLFFLQSLIRLFRDINFVAWVGDYWPMHDLSIRFYMFFLHYYHDHVKYAFYQTDRINEKMNKGKLLATENKKNIIPAIDPPQIDYTKKIKGRIVLCFIGVLVPWQGVEVLLQVVAKNPKVHLKLIGTGEESLVKDYLNLITRYNIKDRVYFPNKFIYGNELKKEIADSHIGMALYTVDPMSVTYYGDPAKIKQYLEYGLPIIMTDAAEVAQYIKKFEAGIIVTKDVSSVNNAIEKIRKNYTKYLHNLDHLNHAFDFRKYYVDKFTFMENKNTL